MKRYDLITEADARLLEIGSTVALNPGGMITPLARDTLAARRVVVVQDALDATLAGLAPSADIKRAAIGSDHSGLTLKNQLRDYLRSRGLAVDDVGTYSTDPVDYPDIAGAVARLVATGQADAGIIIDGAGLGSAIAANKIDGVRAVRAHGRTLARYAREHNGANVLTLGATLLTREDAVGIVDTWLSTPMREARYIRRLAKIRNLERTR
jgi:ribose 5-phosphate isomerase B